jgi:hypothetical protein
VLVERRAPARWTDSGDRQRAKAVADRTGKKPELVLGHLREWIPTTFDGCSRFDSSAVRRSPTEFGVMVGFAPQLVQVHSPMSSVAKTVPRQRHRDDGPFPGDQPR